MASYGGSIKKVKKKKKKTRLKTTSSINKIKY